MLPIARVLSNTELLENNKYFTETPFDEISFHELFKEEYINNGQVSNETFNRYLDATKKYFTAQIKPNNKPNIAIDDFIESLLPKDKISNNYGYFGYDTNSYSKAIKKASSKLADCPMGILQLDLSPFNVLENGVINFESSYGPIGYDVLTSTRWNTGWFTDYPSRYSLAYRLNEDQIHENDQLISTIANDHDTKDPTQYLQDFLFLKSARAVSTFSPSKDILPQDQNAVKRYRANVLSLATGAYLADKTIDCRLLSSASGY